MSQWTEIKQLKNSRVRELRTEWRAYRLFPWLEWRRAYAEGPMFECFGAWTERRWRKPPDPFQHREDEG
jgi:hypothetical protein